MLYKDFRNPNGNNNRGNRPYKPFKEEGFANTEATPLSLEQEADPTDERWEMYYDLVRFPLDKVIVA